MEEQAAISGMMELSKPHHDACFMDAIKRELILQRWGVIQDELMPELRRELGPLTAKLEAVIRTLEWVRIEAFIEPSWCGVGRPPHERAWLANAFVAKAVLGIRAHTRTDRAAHDGSGAATHLRLPDGQGAALRGQFLARV